LSRPDTLALLRDTPDLASGQLNQAQAISPLTSGKFAKRSINKYPLMARKFPHHTQEAETTHFEASGPSVTKRSNRLAILNS